MRTVVFDQHGDPARVLRLDHTDPPGPPGPGQVLIRVLTSPVHPGDLLGVQGPGEPLPAPRTPGAEGMGTVAALGSGVTGLSVGERVAFFPAPGAWREYLLAPAEVVVPVPAGVKDSTAALMLVNPLTLRMLLRAAGEITGPVLQTAAGSSMGGLVAAAAQRHGFPLINLVRREAGAAELRDRFPEFPAISTSDPDWPDQVRAAAGGRGVPVVLDAVGGALTPDLVALLADGGRLISYGALDGDRAGPSPRAIVRRELTHRGVSVLRWQAQDQAIRAEDRAFATELARTRPELFAVAAEYDLAAFTAAVEHVRRPGKTGTVLFTLGEDQS
ncbi:alcohol dehydrogenase catalytic domain-containing protein [Crossiella cryophila]|uniref:NADPH:quinone reductase-like Zn-dependent oxidoreductase n=1 Tax=Crossiella cryophila TaxID=43355 RepID=A0A7W7FWD0_9PSEU|nr:zinc-binding dehydrogenase [Crossiella cryophila]MBB4680137.1 NADPH:quinone reductase-like Zn-dependent oxidoreductase [Crossiella cryophila]